MKNILKILTSSEVVLYILNILIPVMSISSNWIPTSSCYDYPVWLKITLTILFSTGFLLILNQYYGKALTMKVHGKTREVEPSQICAVIYMTFGEVLALMSDYLILKISISVLILLVIVLFVKSDLLISENNGKNPEIGNEK